LPVGELELATLPRDGTREGTLLVAEELRLDQLLGDRRTVHVDERLVGPAAACVDLARHQLLARPVLARDEYPAVRRRSQLDLLLEIPDGLCVPEDLMGPEGVCSQASVLAFEPRLLECVLHGEEQLVDRERLLDEVEGAELRRPYGGLDGAVTRHHHDRQMRMRAAKDLQHLDAVASGHRDVEQHQIGAFTVGELMQRPLAVLGGHHLEALVGENTSEGTADAFLVVDDQDPAHASRPRTGSSTIIRVPRGRFPCTRT
jgi:hypothetical protein